MAFFGMEEVVRAEELARAQYDEAVAQAKHALLVEQRVGERQLDDVRQNEDVELRRRILEAENAAAAKSEELLRSAREACEALKADARSRLDAAAERIMEKVVND